MLTEKRDVDRKQMLAEIERCWRRGNAGRKKRGWQKGILAKKRDVGRRGILAKKRDLNRKEMMKNDKLLMYWKRASAFTNRC